MPLTLWAAQTMAALDLLVLRIILHLQTTFVLMPLLSPFRLPIILHPSHTPWWHPNRGLSSYLYPNNLASITPQNSDRNEIEILCDARRDDCELGLGLLARHDSNAADGKKCHT
jgi:hypothetical protein